MFETREYKFQFSPNELDHISELVNECLKELELDRKEVLRIRLSIEEELLKLLKTSEGSEGSFRFYQKWGHPYIHIQIHGAEVEADQDLEFSEYSNHILENLGIRPEIYYKGGCNHIAFKLKKKERNPLFDIAAAILLAIGIGLLITMVFPQIASGVNEVITPLLDTFLGILATIAGPMIFLSVSWGIICIGDTSVLNRIGKKMMFRFVLNTFVFAIIAFFVGNAFFPLVYDKAVVDLNQFSSIYQMLLDIFPCNFIEPFSSNNSMQIIVIAIAVGVAMLVLERRAKVVADIVEQLNNVVTLLMKIITKLIPLFVFLSLLQMFMNSSFSALVGCWKLILLEIILPFVMLILLLLCVSLRFRVKLSVLVGKMLPTFMIALTTASSAAAFSTNMSCCEEDLGINKKITRFGVPFGIVIYMPVVALNFVLISLYMSTVYGMSISLIWIIIAILSSTILAIAVPPIPGGGLTCYTILFVQLGIPADALVLATIVDIITDFFCTATCMTFLQLELLQQADKMKLLDREILERK